MRAQPPAEPAPLYVEVVVELETSRIPQPFTYRVPPEMAQEMEVGASVLVPFAGHELLGYRNPIYRSNRQEFDRKRRCGHQLHESPIARRFAHVFPCLELNPLGMTIPAFINGWPVQIDMNIR
jgi:hypothetical protein